MSTPKISIVIPIYNPTQFFVETLDSIARQQFQDFEIIVSDDSVSPVKAINILNNYSSLNIKYFQNKNDKGIFNNLNNAIENSSGNLIQIFCQDDIMLDFFLDKQLECLEKHKSSGLVFSRYSAINSINEIIPPLPHLEEVIPKWKIHIPKDKALNYLFVFGCMPGSLSTVMLTRQAINKIGLFNEKFSFGGDYEYWIRVAKEFDFTYNNLVSVHIRSHENQASETLGLFKLIPDAVSLYRYLYNNNTVRANKFKKYLHMNNIVVGNFIGIIKNLGKQSFVYFKLLRYLNSHPFHLFTILLLLIHRKLKGRYTWMIMESDC